MSIISFIFFKITVCELCLNLLFHAFLQCFCFAPYGTTNPWSQTGSMRVRGQMFIVWFLFIILSSYIAASITLCPPFTPPCWKMLNLPHQLPSILPFINIRHLCPPVSSNPALLLPHLVLSVKLPIPMSHALILSSPCDPRLWSCSSRCSIHDVGTRFGHPVCLLSVSHCSHFFDACV